MEGEKKGSAISEGEKRKPVLIKSESGRRTQKTEMEREREERIEEGI